VTVNGNEYLLAANTKSGNIDVLNGTAGQPGLSGNFKDPNLPTGFVPYNVQVLNGVVYVTYEQPGKAGGIVDAFSTSGNFLARVGTGDRSTSRGDWPSRRHRLAISPAICWW